MIAKKAVKITSLPKDVLLTIKSYLGRHKQIFMIAILSSKECDEYRNRALRNVTKSSILVNIIHNTITYPSIFNKYIWGFKDPIPSYKDFQDQFMLSLDDKKLAMSNRFDIIKYITFVLDQSKNYHYKYIVWNNEHIRGKLKYSKYIEPNTFWDNSLLNLRLGKHELCGCIPFCWRCKKECDIYNVKLNDRLVVKSQENNRHYICKVISVKLDSNHYSSVRDIRLQWMYSHNTGNWRKQLCHRITIHVELLPLPHETQIKQKVQCMKGTENFYYMADCYTCQRSWRINRSCTGARKVIQHKIYNIPLGYLNKAKECAKTALALIY